MVDRLANTVIQICIEGDKFNPTLKWNSYEEFREACDKGLDVDDDAVVKYAYISDNLITTCGKFCEIREMIDMVLGNKTEGSKKDVKNILIVVDYQNDFVNGALGFAGAEKLDKGIAYTINEYIDNDDIVIATFDTHDAFYLDSQEGKKLPVKHCIMGEDGWQLFGDTGRLCYNNKSVKNIYKPTFGSAELCDMLRKLSKETKIGSVTLVGLVTNMCVISNAIIAKAALPESEIIVKKYLVDSFDKELHQKALDVMASMQITIAD
jgi:nicotinamidase-related amidase